jgi:hypothetical protein
LGVLPGGMRQISTSKGCRSFRSVDCGLRPSSSETSLPKPTNLPLGEDQASSCILSVLTFRISSSNSLSAPARSAIARDRQVAIRRQLLPVNECYSFIPHGEYVSSNGHNGHACPLPLHCKLWEFLRAGCHDERIKCQESSLSSSHVVNSMRSAPVKNSTLRLISAFEKILSPNRKGSIMNLTPACKRVDGDLGLEVAVCVLQAGYLPISCEIGDRFSKC